MTRFLIRASIAILFLLASGTRGKSNQVSPVTDQNPTQQRQTKAAEAAEADRLITEVVQLYKAGKYDEALPIAKRAVEICAKLRPPDQRLITAALGNLAELYLIKQDYIAAARLFERYLKMYEKVFGSDNPGVAKILEKLALTSYHAGDFEAAEKSYQRLLAITEHAPNADRRDLVSSLYNLAVFYQSRRDFKKARSMYEQLITNMERLFGPNDNDLAQALERYACVLRSNDEMHEADNVESRADAILFRAGVENKETVPLPADIFACRLKVIKRPLPSYPAAATRAGVGGRVIVEVVVSETGNVVSAKTVIGHPLLSPAAEKAAMGAKYAPLMVAGQPVSVKGVLQYRFGGVKVELILVLVPGVVITRF